MNKSTKSKLNKKLIKKLIKYYALLFIKSELIILLINKKEKSKLFYLLYEGYNSIRIPK